MEMLYTAGEVREAVRCDMIRLFTFLIDGTHIPTPTVGETLDFARNSPSLAGRHSANNTRWAYIGGWRVGRGALYARDYRRFIMVTNIYTGRVNSRGNHTYICIL